MLDRLITMLEMKAPVILKYSMLIKHLQRCHRDLLIPKESPTLKKDLLAFITDVTAEINSTDTGETCQAEAKFLLPETWSFLDLFENAHALLIYREYLGIIALHKEQYEHDYIHFCNEQTILKSALKDCNPFILHEHLIHIHNLVADHKTSGQHISILELYQCLLLQVKELIKNMPFEGFGSFVLYLRLLADYSLSLAALETPQDDIGLHSALQERNLRDIYISMTVCKLFIAQSEAQISTEDDSVAKTFAPTEDQRKLNFYLGGKAPFARAPFCSLDALEKWLLSFSLLPSSALVFGYDRAKEQFRALNQETPELIGIEQNTQKLPKYIA